MKRLPKNNFCSLILFYTKGGAKSNQANYDVNIYITSVGELTLNEYLGSYFRLSYEYRMP